MRPRRPTQHEPHNDRGLTTIELLLILATVAMVVSVLIPTARLVQLERLRRQAAASIEAVREGLNDHHRATGEFPGWGGLDVTTLAPLELHRSTTGLLRHFESNRLDDYLPWDAVEQRGLDPQDPLAKANGFTLIGTLAHHPRQHFIATDQQLYYWVEGGEPVAARDVLP